MAASRQFLITDLSTYANYSSWASQISGAIASYGWAQSNDTGQVMWTGMNVTACTASGGNGTYTYNSLAGLPLAVGRALNLTGMTNAGNNKTLVVTSFTGTTSGTFTAVNAGAVTESGSSGVVTQASTVPGSAAYFYEIWTPNDGLTNFFLKLEYGNLSGTNSPSFRITLSSGTNGAGTATGFIAGPTNTNTVSQAGSTTPSLCLFSGALGRICVSMWNGTETFVIERSVNSSGNYIGTYVSYWTVGPRGSNNPNSTYQTLHLTAGPTVFQSGMGIGGRAWNCPGWLGLSTTAFNQSVAIAMATPLVGFHDYYATACGIIAPNDSSFLVPWNATVYGVVHTYVMLQSIDTTSGNAFMRWD